MHTQVIGFIPPVEGVDGSFNTFRLGGTLAKALTVDQEVFLMDEKKKVVFGRARVVGVHVGPLRDMCEQHACWNHRELADPSKDSPANLLAYLRKVFGPHIAVDNKRTSVIYLQRLE